MNDNIINLKNVNFEPGNIYNIELCEFKKYKCTYCGKQKKIYLLTDKSIYFNKKIIFEELIKKNDLVYS